MIEKSWNELIKLIANKIKNKDKKITIVLLVLIIFIIGVAITILGESYKINWLSSLGIGAITSGFITIFFDGVFKMNIAISEKKAAAENRKKFFDQIIYKFYDLLMYLELDEAKEKELLKDTSSIIYVNHRYIHNYYKKMIAKNDLDFETKKIMEYVDKFINYNIIFFEKIKVNAYLITTAGFSDCETNLFNTLNEDFYLTEYYYAKKDKLNAIYFMAMLLNDVKQLIEIKEFNFLNGIDISLDNDNEIVMDKNKLYKTNATLKFIDELREIREQNYKANYSHNKENK